MKPELIAYVLGLPLKARLALVDADPTGPGWLINPPINHGDGRAILCPRVSSHESWLLRGDDSAWLPCNPLAIVEHAGKLRFGDAIRWVDIQATPGGRYVAGLMAEQGRKFVKGFGDSAHEAAIKALAEVVGE